MHDGLVRDYKGITVDDVIRRDLGRIGHNESPYHKSMPMHQHMPTNITSSDVPLGRRAIVTCLQYLNI